MQRKTAENDTGYGGTTGKDEDGRRQRGGMPKMIGEDRAEDLELSVEKVNEFKRILYPIKKNDKGIRPYGLLDYYKMDLRYELDCLIHL